MWYIVGKVYENWIQMLHSEYRTIWPELDIQDGELQTGTSTTFPRLYIDIFHLSTNTTGDVVRLNRKWAI